MNSFTKIKICGITNLDDALAACEAGADALGFVFAPEARKRNRYIGPEQAREIIHRLPSGIMTVAVTVNEPLECLQAYLEFIGSVQLCGEEPPEAYAPIAARAIKTFHLGTEFSPAAFEAHPAAAFLLDTSAPGEHGGSGKTCDWAAARAAVEAAGRPVILAGGLAPENVADAVRAVRPFAVDVSSGVEASPGKKDHERIRDFIRNARIPLS